MSLSRRPAACSLCCEAAGLLADAICVFRQGNKEARKEHDEDEGALLNSVEFKIHCMKVRRGARSSWACRRAQASGWACPGHRLCCLGLDLGFPAFAKASCFPRVALLPWQGSCTGRDALTWRSA